MFFSVKQPLKIMGKVYSPCICYQVTKYLQATVESLVKEDKAVVYEEKVFFQNGKVLKSLDERKAEEKLKIQAEKKAEKEAKKKAKEEKLEEKVEEEIKEEFDDSDF